MPRKYRKKTERQKLVLKLDTVVRELVRARDSNTCQKCGNPGKDVSHVIPRTHKALRWDLNNLKMLCGGCHLYWWHQNPIEAFEWFSQTFPKRASYLQEHKNDVKKFTVSDLKELYEVLKNEIQ